MQSRERSEQIKWHSQKDSIGVWDHTFKSWIAMKLRENTGKKTQITATNPPQTTHNTKANPYIPLNFFTISFEKTSSLQRHLDISSYFTLPTDWWLELPIMILSSILHKHKNRTRRNYKCVILKTISNNIFCCNRRQISELA